LAKAEKKLAFKIVVIGDPSVGKTSLIRRFSDHKFDLSYLPTIGADFNIKVIELPEVEVIMTIWDIGGHDRFQHIRDFYYDGSHGGILAFDLTREKTYENIEKWEQDIRKKAINKDIPIVLMANKSDLRDKIVVNEEDIRKVSESLDMPYFLTSAKNGLNVDQAFEKIAQLCVEKYVK